jgi:hypothetical protein
MILKPLSYILIIWSTARLEICLPNGWCSFFMNGWCSFLFVEKSVKVLHKPSSKRFWGPKLSSKHKIHCSHIF